MCVPGCEHVVRQALSRRNFFAGAAAAGFAATAVGVAPAAAATRRFSRVVDLTHTLSPDFPTYFGVPGIEMERKATKAKDGYNAFAWKLLEHAGTHMDAPIHFTDNGATVDKIAADALVVPLAVVDVSAKAAADVDYLLSRDDLAAWERRHGRLPADACVAMHSGWAKWLAENPAKFSGRDSGRFHFPGFAPAAAEWMLRERKIAGIAVDTLSLDNGTSADFKTHYLWLGAGRWGLENVANLDKVPARGATLVVGAPKVKDATGGPSRLFALI